MPEQTQQAVDWALTQTFVVNDDELQVTKDTPHLLVTMVSRYFFEHDIQNDGFEYEDLIPYL